MLGFSKCLGAAAASRRKRTSQVAKSQTLFDFRASNELMKEAGIEAVTGANSVHSRDFWWKCLKTF